MVHSSRDVDIAIAAHTELPPARNRNATIKEMYRRILGNLIAESGIDLGVVDGIYSIPETSSGGGGTHSFVFEELGVTPSLATTMYSGGATYGIMLRQAAALVEQGELEAVLCIAASNYTSSREAGEKSSQRNSHPEFEYPYGAFVPALYSLLGKQYMHEHNVTTADLSHVSVSSREWALRTPGAYMRDDGPLTVDDVLASRRITDILHLLHCSVPVKSGGGGAFLVTTGALAEEITSRPAYVLGIGEHHAHGYVTQAQSYREGPARSAREAYENASLRPSNVDIAEIYDAFAFNSAIYVEALGLAPEGKGTDFFAEGRGRPGGGLPVNTNGGLLSYGHVGPAAGLSVMNEAIAQARGTAGEHQVDDSDIVLAHTNGGMMGEHSTIIFGGPAR